MVWLWTFPWIQNGCHIFPQEQRHDSAIPGIVAILQATFHLAKVPRDGKAAQEGTIYRENSNKCG